MLLTELITRSSMSTYHKHRRKLNEQDELDALFTHYALALSFFLSGGRSVESRA